MPSDTLPAVMLRLSISPSSSEETRPTSSTSPVNTFLLSAGVERHGDVIPYLFDLSDPELQCLRHLGGPERADHGHTFGAEELRRVEQGQLVGEPAADKASRRLPAALDEQPLDPPPAQLIQYVGKVDPVSSGRRRNNLDAKPLQL